MTREGYVDNPQYGCDHDNHEWHQVEDIGFWIHKQTGTETVAWHAALPDLWENRKEGYNYEAMREFIDRAGGIDCDPKLGYVPKAIRLLCGEIRLTNGVHRWVIARDLGMPTIPVLVTYETVSEVNNDWLYPEEGQA